MTTLLSTLAAVLVSATPAAGPASSDPTAQAKKAFAEGQKAYTQGKYKDALERFETAYAFKALPLLQYNIARCHERLGETAPALRAYRDFLRLSPNPAEKDAVTKAMAVLQRQLQEKGVQQLLVLTEPARASVEVDGKGIGSSPASVELTAGEHTVVARLPDYEVAAQKLVLATAEMVELKLVLQRRRLRRRLLRCWSMSREPRC
jgi:tetratricopeptide (TPR) repeat protein